MRRDDESVLGLKANMRSESIGQPNIRVSIDDRAGSFSARKSANIKANVSKFPLQFASSPRNDVARQHLAHNDSNGSRPNFAAPKARDNSVLLDERKLHVRGENLAGASQTHSPRSALEQRHSDFFFEGSDLSADGRSCYMQVFTCCRNGPRASHFIKVAQCSVIHVTETSARRSPKHSA